MTNGSPSCWLRSGNGSDRTSFRADATGAGDRRQGHSDGRGHASCRSRTAMASVETGATRQEAQSYYFELINHYVSAGDTALHMAAAAHNVELVNMLLDIGAVAG